MIICLLKSSFNKEISTLHFGEAASMPAHNVMYQHVYKEELNRITTELKEKEKKEAEGWFAKGLKLAMSVEKGKFWGTHDAVKDTVVDTYQMVTNPKETIQGIKHIFSHPIDTASYIGKALYDSFERDMINGDAESRSRWITYAKLSVVGTKGSGSALKATGKAIGSKAPKAIEVTRKVAEGIKDSTKTYYENLRNIELFPEPLAFAGIQTPSIKPYNAYDSKSLKEQLLMQSRAGEFGKGTGNVKHLDDVPRIKEVEVNFKRNDKHGSEEFARQLKDQEKGMNELTIDEYLKNRDRYIAEGRAIEGNAAQKMARQEALKDKIAELRKQGLSRADATKQASEWLGTKAALHNPDQIAGGRADTIGGMGDKRVNSSIGSQWKYRIDIVDEQIREIAKNMSPEQLKNTYLNVKLTQ